MDIDELVSFVINVVANPSAAIAIRDSNSIYVFVNDAWVDISGTSREDAIGKRLDELPIVPAEQSHQFLTEDKQTIQQQRLVTINVYHVQSVTPIRFMSVRTYIKFKNVGYIIEVSFILGPLVISSMLYWSSERLERAFGEDLAGSLLNYKE